MNKQNQIKLNHKCCVCNKDIYLGTLTTWEKKFYHTSCLLEEVKKKKDKDFDWFVKKLKEVFFLDIPYSQEFILFIINKLIKELKEKTK